MDSEKQYIYIVDRTHPVQASGKLALKKISSTGFCITSVPLAATRCALLINTVTSEIVPEKNMEP